jgi:FAD/FMN-containing dehydrogenase
VLGPKLLDSLFNAVTQLGGSISAEHGVGRTKRTQIARMKAGASLRLMKLIKNALDPNRVLNAGIGVV